VRPDGTPTASEELIDRWERYLSGTHGLQRVRLLLKRWAWELVIGGSRLLKRLFDLVVGGAMLVLSVPIWLGLAVFIKLDSPGPVFFKQTRVGRRGRLFLLYKFRTMYVDAERRKAELMRFNEAGGVIFKMKDDPRVTRAGRFLRRTSLDELPQLLNVLLGDMSVVGPRPPVPAEVVQYTPAERRRLDAEPGLTCIWQVSGRSSIPFEGQVRLDVQYIETRSLWRDLWILLKTVPAVVLGRGAY
jgi:exopolysaccharide biosynthesis polyprenyl glycosylphosphotransferase